MKVSFLPLIQMNSSQHTAVTVAPMAGVARLIDVGENLLGFLFSFLEKAHDELW